MKNIDHTKVSPDEWSQSTATDFESQMAAFHALLPDLLRKHKGQFVAISEGNLIDSDQNEFALVKRVSCLKPSAFVLIQEVTEKSFSTINRPEEVPA